MKGRVLSRPFFLSVRRRSVARHFKSNPIASQQWRRARGSGSDHRLKGTRSAGSDTIDAYAYKIYYVNHNTTFYVEKLILVAAPLPSSRLGNGLRRIGQKQL
jgi:hypothetical protein